jgi:hypothetical protein
MECGGYQCQCALITDDGEEFTIGEEKAVKAGFDPNQPRDEGGQWSETGVGGLSPVAFGDTVDSAAGQALGGKIAIDRDQYSKMDRGGKRFLVAHEMTHELIEDKVLTTPGEWDKASAALMIAERDGKFLFIGGETRIGEAISSSVGSYVTGSERPPGISLENWNRAMNWSEYAVNRFAPQFTLDEIDRIISGLDAQL